MAEGIDVSKLLLSKVVKHYYKSRDDLVKNHSRYISGRKGWPADTCALRVSLALSLAGIRLPMARAWVHTCPTCKKLVLPASASEYYKGPILKGARTIQTILDIKNEKGIFYMEWADNAHITFWDTGKAVDKTLHHFHELTRLFFWRLA